MMQQFKPQTAPKARAHLILAHGAGAGLESEFMQEMGAAIAAHDIAVWLFNFPYMEKAKLLGKKRPPDRAPVLLDAWQSAIEAVTSHSDYKDGERLYIGGKSMGGRMATVLATDPNYSAVNNLISGVVALGYPFHPPGKPDKLRIEHLHDTAVPMLIVQGERDTFGNVSRVNELSLSPSITVEWLTDGDHSFKPRKASGIDQHHNIQKAAKEVAKWIA